MTGPTQEYAAVITQANPVTFVLELTTDFEGPQPKTAVGYAAMFLLPSPGGKGNAVAKLAGFGFKRLLKFSGDEAVEHFAKHSGQIMKVSRKTTYNLKEYFDDANWIIENGTFSAEHNGYYYFMGNAARGESLFGFVGLKNGGNMISTFHFKTATQLGLK